MLLISGTSLSAANDDNIRVPTGASAGVLDAKIRKDSENALLRPQKATKVPIEEEAPSSEKQAGPSFYVGKIILEGDVFLDSSEYEPLLAKFERQNIHFQQLQQLINLLEQYLRAKGYIAVVLLPPQKMVRSEIHLKIVVSRMGQLSVEKNRFYTTWRTQSYWKTRQGQILRYDNIRRDVLDMNENPDRVVKPILRAGKEKGSTDVVLDVLDHLPLHAGYSFDNQGVKLTGKDRQGFTIRDNNLLGLDDTFLMGTNFGNAFGALYLYYMVPVTNFGTKFICGYSHAQVTPKKEFKIYGINSVSDTYSLALQQRLLRTDRYSANARIGFDFKEKSTHTQSVTTAWDNERVLSASGTFQARDSMGGWALSPGIAFGMPNRGPGWPLASRGGDSGFFKFTSDLTRYQQMPFGTRFLWDVQAQLTPNKMLPQEQMFLGGAKSVRGYPESDYGADQAVQSRLDYLLPIYGIPEDWKLPFDTALLKDQLAGILFYDVAYGSVHDHSSSEEKHDFLMGVGAGFELKFRKNLSGRLEWGVPLGNRPETESGHSQFHFTLTADY